VEQDESLNFLLRDTISLTMLGGSEQTNVIPPEAWANLDVRILPGGDPKQLLETIRQVVDDPNVTVAPIERGFPLANSSPTNTRFVQRDSKVSAAYFPGTPVVPRHGPAVTPRISATGRWESTPTVSIRTRPRKKKAARSTETTNASGSKRCGAGLGFV
jgi:acetylornithine deacetylase/succinyl-diaminopimelate desuccinylase-like protein